MEISKADAYGGVLISAGYKVLLCEPTNHFGGYAWTFPKGRPDPRENPAAAALREVREEAGYAAEILAPLPGVFKGTTTSTAFFLMGPIGRQAALSWETASTRWVQFEEAERLIAETTTATGRERDLAVLRSARRVREALSPERGPGACAEDFTTKELPKKRATLELDVRLSESEMARIRKGFVPTAQEQKWSAWFAEGVLHIHRSWTGFCVFRVRFAHDAQRWRAVSALANRAKTQYANTDGEEDRRLVTGLVEQLARQPYGLPGNGMEAALALMSGPNYLGSPEVVSSLLEGFVSLVARTVQGLAKGEDVYALNHRLSDILSGRDPAYTAMPGWHTREALGNELIRLFGLNAPYCEGEDLCYVVSEALAALKMQLQSMLYAFLRDEAAEWARDALPQLNAVHAFSRDAMLGVAVVTFPGRVLGDFAWQPVGGTADG